MKVEIKPGKYVLAVSGGVDSMVLLDILAKKPRVELIVAHFNHGIRRDSAKDEQLVKKTAKRLGLAVEIVYGHLGEKSSEDKARKARYKFLETVQDKHQADAIITAHHQDDLVETVIINLLRGTGRRGLVSMLANKKVIRPLINFRKSELMAYARANKLTWHEDSTNSQDDYLRNYIRRHILSALTDHQRTEILNKIEQVAEVEKILNPQIAKLSHIIYKNSLIDRKKFANLPVKIGDELIVYWLRQKKMEFDSQTITRLNLSLRTSKAGTTHPVKSGLHLEISKNTAQFTHTL